MNGHNGEMATQSRGVNITSDDFEQNEEDQTIRQDTNASRLQTDIQNMIDVIETSTPHFLYTSSSVDGDNEESLISSTSIVSSVVKVKQMGINKDSSITNNCQSETSGHVCGETYSVFPERHYESSQPLCLPAVLPPAVLCMNPHCVCTHSKGFVQHIPMHPYAEEKLNDKNDEKKHRLSTIFEKITGNYKDRKRETVSLDLYKMKVAQQKDDGNLPKRFVFDLIDSAPKPDLNTTGTNTKMLSREAATKTPTKHGVRSSQYTGMVVTHQSPDEHLRLKRTWSRNVEEKNKYKHTKDNSTRVDVYYFDHGNAAYYRTTDNPPIIITELMAEKTENYATKFWAELFGTIYIGFAFITSFVLQLFRFICHSIIRPLTIGMLQLLSDYFLKPFLAVCFNSIIQPPLIFVYNIATSLRDLCDPIAEGIGYFLRETAVLCRSIRLFDIKTDRSKCASSNAPCTCIDDKNVQKV